MLSANHNSENRQSISDKLKYISENLKYIELKYLTDTIANLHTDFPDEAEALKTLIPVMSGVISGDYAPYLMRERVIKMRAMHAAKPVLIAVLDNYEQKLLPIHDAILRALPTEAQITELAQIEMDQKNLAKLASEQVKNVGSLPLSNINSVIEKTRNKHELRQYGVRDGVHEISVDELNDNILSYNREIEQSHAQLTKLQNEIDLNKVVLSVNEVDSSDFVGAKDELRQDSEQLAQQIEAIDKLIAKSEQYKKTNTAILEEEAKVTLALNKVTQYNQDVLDNSLSSRGQEYFAATLASNHKLSVRMSKLALLPLPNEENAISIIKGLSVNTSEAELRALFNINRHVVNEYQSGIKKIQNSLAQVNQAIDKCEKNIQHAVKQNAVGLRNEYLQSSSLYNPANQPKIQTIDDAGPLAKQLTEYRQILVDKKNTVEDTLEAVHQKEREVANQSNAKALFKQLTVDNPVNMHKIHKVLHSIFEDEVIATLAAKVHVKEPNDAARAIYKETYKRFVISSEIIHACGNYNLHLQQNKHYEAAAKKASAPGFKLSEHVEKVTLAHKIKVNEDLYQNFITTLGSKGSVQAIDNMAQELQHPLVQLTLRAHRDGFGARLLKALTFIVRSVDACLFGRSAVTFYKPNGRILADKLEKKINTCQLSR